MESDREPAARVGEYSLLGRSGLRVSPLCLGTMTFGTDWGWGTAEDSARRILDRYLDVGGNFVDTADRYTNGTSEALLGKFLKERGDRDRLVLATKFSFNSSVGDPNAGGNSRKNIYRALEGSLRRLQTDYVDLYWLHVWDGLTPVGEVMSTLSDLVRSGKVRYIGLSDVPAWYLARAQTLAELRGQEGVCALQLEYSLVERHIEREHIPAALELGMAICPWSPLGSGLLTGKYRPSGVNPEGAGRLDVLKSTGHPAFVKLFSERNWRIVEELLAVAKELDRSPAQVALNWISTRPAVASTLIGATTLAQLDDNLRALTFHIPAVLAERLEKASRPEVVFPYNFFDSQMRSMLTGGTLVRREPLWFRPT
jgi:aryl-alcohol dehydrogenase-like predicted oxidoreductase